MWWIGVRCIDPAQIFRCSDFADISARYEATACLEPARLVIGINKIAEMRLRLDMAFVVMPPDGPGFDCAVHAVNLPMCPRVCWLG